jgi:hypothetical protein
MMLQRHLEKMRDEPTTTTMKTTTTVQPQQLQVQRNQYLLQETSLSPIVYCTRHCDRNQILGSTQCTLVCALQDQNVVSFLSLKVEEEEGMNLQKQMKQQAQTQMGQQQQPTTQS